MDDKNQKSADNFAAKKELLPEAELYAIGLEPLPKNPSHLPKTIGERAYNGIQFWFVKGLILGATGYLGYYAKFGNETNVIRQLQLWFRKWIQKPMGQFGDWSGKNVESIIGGAKEETRGKIGHWVGGKTQEILTVSGAAAASTTLLSHGGNVVAPVVMWFENHRRGIIDHVNRRWGKPGDEAIGNEKFKDLPQQNAGDVIKGRIMAWSIILFSFLATYIMAGKIKGTDMYRLDWLEENFARRMSGFKKTFSFGPNLGEKIANIPMHCELTELAKNHPDLAPLMKGHERRFTAYKVSRIIALDIFATSMAIIIWNFTSRLSARGRAQGKSFGAAIKERLGFGKDKHSGGNENALPDPEARDTVSMPSSDEAKKSAPETANMYSDRIAKPARSHAATAFQRKQEPTTSAVAFSY